MKGGTENYKSFKIRYLHQNAYNGPFTYDPGNRPVLFAGRQKALSYLQFFNYSGKIIGIVVEDLDLSALSVTAN